ncbi:MAG TPA: hypothetical protein VLN08_11780, partial [Vicinamibacterales bacterium]|nr:hypothetical protein [Vicinamibacterales bacterium]
IEGHAGALFTSPALRNFPIAVPPAPSAGGDPVPADILKAAGWTPDAKRAPGAYQAVRSGAVK